MENTESHYLEDTSAIESERKDMVEVLQNCLKKAKISSQQWRNAQESLLSLEKINVDSVDSIVRGGMEANQIFCDQFSFAVLTAHEDVDTAINSCLTSIDHSLQLDHDACGNMNSMIVPCCEDLRELKGGHYHKIVEITENTVKCLEDEYMVLDNFLESQTVPSKLSRISVSVNSKVLPTYALNDILIAHPCPATVSRFSFKIKRDDKTCLPLVNCRSSGLRVSTVAGSTAAMLSAGGFAMPILPQDLQYMVREPILPGGAIASLMHGLIKSDQSLDAAWFCKEGLIYVDGSHVFYTIQNGDTIEISSKALVLQVILPPHL